MAYSDLDKLKAFFLALNKSHFHPERMDPAIITSKDKAYCFDLLRQRIPELKDKDDDYISKYLADPRFVKNYVLPKFVTAERIELEKSLAEQPAVTEPASGQMAEQQAVPAAPPASTATSGLPFSMPTGGPAVFSSPSPQRVLAAEKPTSGKAGGTGQGSAATAKANRLAKNFSSSSQIFAKKMGGKVFDGLKGIASGGLGAAAPALGRLGHGLASSLQRISQPGIGSLASKAKGRGGLIFGLGILGFMLLVGGIAISGSAPTGEAAPIAINTPSDLDYTLPLRDKNIQPVDIRTTIKNFWPQAQIDNWPKIVDQAVANNWNPAVVLALWIEESGAQGESFYSDALGCAPAQPTTDINVSLKCLFNNFSQFTNDQFPQFMAKYSGGAAENPFAINPNFPKNFKNWYSQLVPSGAGAITALAAVPILTGGNYQKWLADFGIIINDGFVADVYKWAYEVLVITPSIAPKFKTLLGSSPVEVRPSCDVSSTRGRTILLRNRVQFCPGANLEGPTREEKLFKQVFIHELGHIINGSRPGKYGDQIKQVIAAEGYLTTYSKNAATGSDEICGAGSEDTRADEDFAEGVSYFINRETPEQDYGCGVSVNQNPLFLYPKHYQLMIDLLK